MTLHMPMRDIFANISADAIKSRILLADTVMRSLGAARPRIAVCALNPHAGESGLFGDEEQSVMVSSIGRQPVDAIKHSMIPFMVVSSNADKTRD